MAFRGQNSHKPYNETPSYYAENNTYVGSYVRNTYPDRTSRRMHDGLVLATNYGLDTQSDDLNSSMYSSPYYINGRFNTTNYTAQRGNAGSIQGCERLASYGDKEEDFTEDDIETTLKMHQGQQIKFTLDYNGRVIGNTITLKNTDGCTGILSIYFSTKDGGEPIYETAIDLCKISTDVFEHKKVYSITPFERKANPRGKIYVRMEIWNEISQERSENPFNTGRNIEIAATGKGTRYEAEVKLGDKNVAVNEKYNYTSHPSRPLIGLIYNNWETVPTFKRSADTSGATVYKNNYRYDIFCAKNSQEAKVLIYDNAMNKFLDDSDVDIKLDSRVKRLNFVQANDYVYYVDGYSALQKFKIGEWKSRAFDVSTADNVSVSVDFDKFSQSDLGNDSGRFVFRYKNGQWSQAAAPKNLEDYGISISGPYTDGGQITVDFTKTEDDLIGSVGAVYTDARPVLGASIIHFQQNRIYLSGFRYDRNLVQFSEIDSEGPNYDSYPYRFYSPDESPLATSDDNIVAMCGYESDTFMILGKKFFSTFQGSSSSSNPENAIPSQVASYLDSSGVQDEDDVCTYQGVMYSFDADEGIRRYSGGTWSKIPSSIDSYYERVDMTKNRLLWGYGNRLYLFYTDKIDKKYKALVWDKEMNYQQYPWFQDVDLPIADVRWNNDYDLIAAHAVYPCVIALYKQDTWRRFDTPITFERWTKNIPTPGYASDMILKTVNVNVLANANRWWWVGVSWDKPSLEQHRGKTLTFRFPVWDTLEDDVPAEDAFNTNDFYVEDALSRLSINVIKKQASAVRVKVKCRTFREQASFASVGLEIQAHQYK